MQNSGIKPLSIILHKKTNSKWSEDLNLKHEIEVMNFRKRKAVYMGKIRGKKGKKEII